jgi:hypothetical protein
MVLLMGIWHGSIPHCKAVVGEDWILSLLA